MTTSTLDMHAEPREYNGRIILDAATLRFDRGTGDARWIVASIMPTAGTGEARALRLGADQEMLLQIVFREVGSWVLVAALEGDGSPERGTYDWNEPKDDPLVVTRLDLYDVFSDMNRGRRAGAGGGIIVTRYDATGEGRKPFCEVSVIPPAWHETVQSSFDAFRRGEPPFAATTSRDEALSALLAIPAPSVPALVHAERPLTAVAAFRRLATDVGANRDELQQAILAANGYLRAVFACLTLHEADDKTTASEVLQTVIEAVDTMGGLPALVAGIGTAAVLTDMTSAIRKITSHLRGVARARLERIHAGGDIDPFLKRILYP